MNEYQRDRAYAYEQRLERYAARWKALAKAYFETIECWEAQYVTSQAVVADRTAERDKLRDLLDEVATKAAQARAEVHNLTCEREYAIESYTGGKVEIEKLQRTVSEYIDTTGKLYADNERLRSALRRFGQHRHLDCYSLVTDPPSGCLCGLDAALGEDA